MQQIPISKFKATCLAVIEEVKRTRKPVLVTRRGEPMAEVAPPRPAARRSDWIGSWTHLGRIQGDIVSPASEESDWEVLRD